MCSLHLSSFVRRFDDVARAGVREVVVFHSEADELRKHAAHLPFAAIADPDKHLYREFGVEASAWALLDPRVWPTIVVAVTRAFANIVRGHASPPALRPHGGRWGLPANFLLAPDGRVLAYKYGSNADDQWSLDELLRLAHAAARERSAATLAALRDPTPA